MHVDMVVKQKCLIKLFSAQSVSVWLPDPISMHRCSVISHCTLALRENWLESAGSETRPF